MFVLKASAWSVTAIDIGYSVVLVELSVAITINSYTLSELLSAGAS